MSNASSTEAVCWCTSDVKCPHRIESKLDDREGEMEVSINLIIYLIIIIYF